MHQLLANQIRDQTQYARLPEVLKLYLEELHALCPDARSVDNPPGVTES
jgi:hypothetical protein